MHCQKRFEIVGNIFSLQLLNFRIEQIFNKRFVFLENNKYIKKDRIGYIHENLIKSSIKRTQQRQLPAEFIGDTHASVWTSCKGFIDCLLNQQKEVL